MILKDRVAVITGAGSGMGRASALRFASEGASVVVVEIDEAAANDTVTMIKDGGGHAVAMPIDATNVHQLGEMFDFVDKEFARLDVLFCHVGGGSERRDLDFDERDFQRTVDMNLKGGTFGAVLGAPLLAKTGGGSIILTASVAALHGSGPVLYGMTKAAVLHFTRSLAVRLGPDKIRANAILPGPILTPALRRYLSIDSEGGPARAEWSAAHLPLRRLGTPEDVANVALFLASDASAFVTGVALPVDGGLSATG
jgi:NAD(P)-dependent dehydrogenase (short-subunit alcohol dehydrogenase family)